MPKKDDADKALEKLKKLGITQEEFVSLVLLIHDYDTSPPPPPPPSPQPPKGM